MKSTKTVYSVGDKVKVKADGAHDKMQMSKTGKIAEIGTPALGIKFAGTDKVHKWYADKEVTKVAAKPMKMPAPKKK